MKIKKSAYLPTEEGGPTFQAYIDGPDVMDTYIMGPPEPEEIVLQPGEYLIQDPIFGTLIVGEIGRRIYTKEYIREMYYPNQNWTKEQIKAMIAEHKKNFEEYVEKKFERVQTPFTDMVSTLAQVRWVLHFRFNFPYDSIRPEVDFVQEFGIDSLEMHYMLVEFEHYFQVPIDEDILKDIEEEKIRTVQDLMDYLDFKRGKEPGKNLYPNGILYPAPPGISPVYPSKNLFRNSLV